MARKDLLKTDQDLVLECLKAIVEGDAMNCVNEICNGILVTPEE